MVPAAPRYDERILDAIQALDDREEPIAETCRRVGVVAERLGLTRPSYVHVRRYVHVHRELEDAKRRRRAELLRIAADVYWDGVLGRRIDPWEVEERVRRAGR